MCLAARCLLHLFGGGRIKEGYFTNVQKMAIIFCRKGQECEMVYFFVGILEPMSVDDLGSLIYWFQVGYVPR